MRGRTAKNSVLPRYGERSSCASSSTGTYTRAGASAISSSLSCSALWRETVKSGLSALFLTIVGGTKSNTRRFGTAVRCASICASASRRRALSAPALTARPPSSATAHCAAENTVPPVFLRRVSTSSAVTARLRAASGTAPVTVTAWPSASSAVRCIGSPARMVQFNASGTSRRFSFS